MTKSTKVHSFAQSPHNDHTYIKRSPHSDESLYE